MSNNSNNLNNNKALFVGVDGGGTSTTIYILSSSSFVLSTSSTGSTNFNSVGIDVARSNLHTGLLDALGKLLPSAATGSASSLLPSIRSACLCMSGCNSQSDASSFVSLFNSLFTSQSPPLNPPPFVSAYNDSIGALASGTGGDLNGIVLISGTGMICHGRRIVTTPGTTSNLSHTAGGNGCLIDPGSGYSLGLAAIRSSFASNDGMAEYSPNPIASSSFTSSILSQTRVLKVDELVNWLYANGGRSWGEVASLAPVVLKEAGSRGRVGNTKADGERKKADAEAFRIVKENADYLVRSVKCVYDKLNFRDLASSSSPFVPIVLTGGILEDELMFELVSNGIQEQCGKDGVELRLTHPKMDPAQGAALLAIRAMW